MNFKRNISENEITLTSLILNAFFLFIKYYTFHSLLIILNNNLKKLKSYIQRFSLLELFLTLFNVTCFFILFDLLSFKNLRDKIFTMFINNFETDSNLRDIDSFHTYYCLGKAENNFSLFCFFENIFNYINLDGLVVKSVLFTYILLDNYYFIEIAFVYFLILQYLYYLLMLFFIYSQKVKFNNKFIEKNDVGIKLNEYKQNESEGFTWSNLFISIFEILVELL
jgi:hypothetical protein